MTSEGIKSAVKAAREFIKRADVVVKANEGATGWIWGSRETGALRRQSMELTRALADMRRFK